MFNGEILFLEPSKDKINKSDRNVKTTYIDNDIYINSVSNINNIKKEMYQNDKTNFLVELFAEDLFYCIYKVCPEIFHKQDVVEEQFLLNDLIKKIVSDDNFIKLREITVGNLFISSLYISCIKTYASNIINFLMLNEEIAKMFIDIENIHETRKLINDNKSNNSLNLRRKLESNIKELSKTKKEIADDLISELLIESESAFDFITEVNDFFDLFGGMDSSKVMKIPNHDKIQLAKLIENNPKFRDICNELGRMKEMIKYSYKKSSTRGNSVSDVGLGNNMLKMLSSEKLNLVESELEDNFYKKFIDKELLELKTDKKELGKGPIIICIDESGSMYGKKEIWSKAFVISCIQIALKQKRDCKVITFSDKLGKFFEFEKNKIDLNEIINFSEYFVNGNTNYDEVLEEVLVTINTSKYKKADVLFLTDGRPGCEVDDRLLNSFMKSKMEKEFKVQSILIEKKSLIKYVKPFSDEIIEINNILKDELLSDVFKNIQI